MFSKKGAKSAAVREERGSHRSQSDASGAKAATWGRRKEGKGSRIARLEGGEKEHRVILAALKEPLPSEGRKEESHSIAFLVRKIVVSPSLERK